MSIRTDDTKQLSSVDDALTIITAFRMGQPTGGICRVAPAARVPYQVNPMVDGPWLELDRCHVADGLQAIVTDPYTGVSLDQSMLPLCGPVAWWNVVAARHPVAVAQAAVDLYENGEAMLGGLKIKPDPAVLYAPLYEPVDPLGQRLFANVGGPNGPNYVPAGLSPSGSYFFRYQGNANQRASQATWMLAGSLPRLPGRLLWNGNPKDSEQGSYLHDDLMSSSCPCSARLGFSRE